MRLNRRRWRRCRREKAETLGGEVESFLLLVVIKNEVALVGEGADDCAGVEGVVQRPEDGDTSADQRRDGGGGGRAGATHCRGGGSGAGGKGWADGGGENGRRASRRRDGGRQEAGGGERLRRVRYSFGSRTSPLKRNG